ncbi:MAG: hypothetical protein MZV64_06570 [Ignavibacteriales bacterium]|nr:hypothetical protein [Ignavibacteriales bacterium]
MLHGIEPGDNIVWEVGYDRGLPASWSCSYADGGARGAPAARLLPLRRPPAAAAGGRGRAVTTWIPVRGFENFVRAVHAVIEAAGRGAHLRLRLPLPPGRRRGAPTRCLGNFFMLTCPRLLGSGDGHLLRPATATATRSTRSSRSATPPSSCSTCSASTGGSTCGRSRSSTARATR